MLKFYQDPIFGSQYEFIFLPEPLTINMEALSKFNTKDWKDLISRQGVRFVNSSGQVKNKNILIANKRDNDSRSN